MTSRRKHAFLAILTILVAAAAIGTAGAGWLLWTTPGSTWLVRKTVALAPYPVEAGAVSGSIAGGLRLRSLVVHAPSATASVDSVRLRLRPFALLTGTVSLEYLAIDGVTATVVPQGPQEKRAPLELRWPTVGGFPAWIAARIDSLHLSKVTVRRPDGPSQNVEEAAARVSWTDGVLRLSRLRAVLPSLRVEGSLTAGFVLPRLRADLEATFGKTASRLKRASLSVHLGPVGGGRTRLAGPVTLAATLADESAVRLTGTASYGGGEAALRDLVLSLDAQPRVATGHASVVASRGEPHADVRFVLHGLDVFRQAGFHTRIEGSVSLRGTSANYEGGFSLANRASGPRNVRLTGTVSGNRGGISVSRLTGRWIGGDVGGTLGLRWEDGIAFDGSLSAEGLNPERISPKWPGRINGELFVTARRKANSPLSAEVRGRLLASTLRNLPLTGEVQAQVAGKDVRIVRLEVHGDGFDGSAAGRLRERLTFSVDIRRLSGLLSGAEGSAKVHGWTRWRDGSPEGSLSVRASNLAVSNVAAKSFSVTARRDAKDRPFAVRVRGHGLTFRGVPIDSVDLAANGTPEAHRATLSLQWAAGDASAAVRGGYRSGTWAGGIETLFARDKDIGTWSLADPVAVTVSSGKATIAPFVLDGPGAASLRGSADIVMRPLRGRIRAQWNAIDPSLADPWLRGTRLSGRTSGRVSFSWPAGGRIGLSAQVSASGRIVHAGQVIAVHHADAEATWDKKGLAARVRAGIGDNGSLVGTLSSARPARLGFPAEGDGRATWKNLDLSLLAAAVPDARIAGRSSGDIRGQWRRGERVALDGEADLSATIGHGELQMEVPSAHVRLRADEGGIRVRLSAALGKNGAASLTFASDAPARLRMPSSGRIQASLKTVDLTPLAIFLPKSMDMAGTLSGSADGELRAGGTVDLQAEAHVAGGKVSRKSEGGVVEARLRTADLRLRWKGDSARVEASVELQKHGRARATLELPLPASLPLSMRRNGKIAGSVSAKVEEKGLLSALAPGMVQETFGTVDVDLRIGGTWESPDLQGTVALADAGAYLPALNIRLTGVKAAARITGEQIHVDSLVAHSGDGNIEGTATIRLRQWRFAGYQAAVKGKDFRAVDLPEFRMNASPALSLDGTDGRLKIRGDVAIPYLLISGKPVSAQVKRSQDVVIVDRTKPREREHPLALDVAVNVTLGKHVLVKAQGIDARLAGSIMLHVNEKNDVTAQGEIHVEQGAYAAYGIRLSITQGRVVFGGGPVQEPTLDILATRTVQDVKAGVQVTGTPKRPVVKLYSEPPMEDTNILSYIVLGHPIGEQQGQADALGLAAGALLPLGQSTVLRDRIGRQFGLDVVGFQPGTTAGESVLTVGKYLNPNLYVGYGRALFGGSNLVTVRYKFRKRWEVESQLGQTSGIDLYYRIEFR